MSCAICLEETGEIEYTKCNHGFHKECLDQWHKVSDKCPMCRTMCSDCPQVLKVEYVVRYVLGDDDAVEDDVVEDESFIPVRSCHSCGERPERTIVFIVQLVPVVCVFVVLSPFIVVGVVLSVLEYFGGDLKREVCAMFSKKCKKMYEGCKKMCKRVYLSMSIYSFAPCEETTPSVITNCPLTHTKCGIC